MNNSDKKRKSKLKKESKYVDIKLPKGLVNLIDDYIKTHNDLSYRSRAEFINELIRSFLRKEEHTKIKLNKNNKK